MMNVCVDVSLRVLWGIHQVSAVGLTRSRLCAPIQMCSFIDAASRCKLLSEMLDALHVGVPAQSHGAALGAGPPLAGHEQISSADSLESLRALKENCFIHKAQKTLSGD